MVGKLRNRKNYSSTEEPDEDNILSSSTMKSTRHNNVGANDREGSVVRSSEIELVSRPDNVPEQEMFRMPVITDAGETSPMPALFAEDQEMVDTARAIFALESFNYDHNEAVLPAAQWARNPAEGSAAYPEHVIYDGAVHIDTQNEQSSETNKEITRESGSLANDSLGSLLEHEAQPRETSTEPMELSDPDKGREDISLKGTHGTSINPKKIKLIDGIENSDKRTGKNGRKVHLMLSGRDPRKRPKERHEYAEENIMYSTHDRNGKVREAGTRTDESAQIELDRKLAEIEQARLYRETGVDTKLGNLKRSAKGISKPRRKSDQTRAKGKSSLDETQRIETPSPVPQSKAPESSPVRAVGQLPSGGYLVQPWMEASDGKRKASYQMSKHTHKRIKHDRDQLEGWREKSDIPESEEKREPPVEPPPSYESIPHSSSNTDITSSSDASTSVEYTDATVGTSDSESDESNTYARIRSLSAHRKSSRSRIERKNVLAKAVKYPEPSAYDGRTYLETFETFVSEFQNWIKVNCLPERYQMIAIKRFLTDKANLHHMTFAKPHIKKWTVVNYLKALFNYCFIIHFRSRMRMKFNRCVQGNRSTREFLRELRTLGNHLPDIGDAQIRSQLWEGSNPYLRVEWARLGLNPETSSLTELGLVPERFEIAKTLHESEDKRSYKAGCSSTAVSNTDEYRSKRRDRTTVYKPKKRCRSKWRRDASSAGSTNSDTSLSAKKTSSGTRSGETRVKRKKMTNDRLRAGNQCVHGEEPGHFAKDYPTKKNVRPAASATSLSYLDSLHTTVDKISVLSMVPRYDNFSDERKVPAPSPNSKRTFYHNAEHSSHHEHRSELLKNPYNMDVPREVATRTLIFAYKVCERLNQSVSKLEYELLKPVNFQGQLRYEGYFRRHGHSMVVMDMFAERGIEIQTDAPGTVEEVVTLIQQRQFLDICRGSLNGDKTLSRIFRRIEKILENPANELALPAQHTKQFRVHKTSNPDYIAVEDLREMPEREGDVPPLYWLRISWLFGNWDLLSYIRSCSFIYNKIRTDLYMAVPLIWNHPNIRETRNYAGNRFTITMGEPEVWHIEDQAANKKLHLWAVQANDEKFGITQWYLFELSIYDYERRLFRNIVGQHADERSDNYEPNADNLMTPPADANNSRPVGGKTKRQPVRKEIVKEAKLEGEHDSYYEYEKGRLRRRSPRPYPNAPNRSRGLSEARMRQRSVREPNNDSDLPSLDNVLSTRLSDYERSDDARTLNKDSTDEIMDNAPDQIDEPDKPDPEGFDPAKYHDLPRLAPSVLAAIHLVSSRTLQPSRKRKLTKPGPTISGLKRLVVCIKDFESIVPHLIVIEALVDGRAAHTLDDTGSLAGLIFTRHVNQLRLSEHNLNEPLPVLSATAGTETIERHSVNERFTYQGINKIRKFDVINTNEYCIILGTLFLYQYKEAVGSNPSQMALETKKAAPIAGMQIAVMLSKAADALKRGLDLLCKQLQGEAGGFYIAIFESPTPFMVLNHTIPLIDKIKIYLYHASRCLDAMKSLWREEKGQHIRNGRQRLSTDSNASPLLILWKPKQGPNEKPRIRTVVDERMQNAYTKKLSSPLPDMEVMLCHAAKHKYRNMIDGKNANEQIRVVPEHVHRMLSNTPDGAMQSLVLRQGDCNDGATYQALMNHIFTSYIGSKRSIEQRAFDEIKDRVSEYHNHRRININDSKGAPLINITSDTCLEGAGGNLSREENIETARNVTLWPGKLNPAQQNYPKRERELLAIVKSLKRFKPLIFGRRFCILAYHTDHEALEYLMKETNLSHRQARSVREDLSELEFEIIYIPGKDNKFSDALSRMSSHSQKGTVRTKSEFVSNIHETNKLAALDTVTPRSRDTMTLDTGSPVFQRIGLVGKSVQPVVIDPDDAKGSAAREPTENDTEENKSIKDKSSSGKENARRDDAYDYEFIAYPDKGDDDVDISDESEEIVPAELVSTSEYGLVVRPSKRREHVHEELCNHKKKLSESMAEPEEKGISKPLTIRLRPGKCRYSTRDLEGEKPSELTTEARESVKDSPNNYSVEQNLPDEKRDNIPGKEISHTDGDNLRTTDSLTENDSNGSSDPEITTALKSNTEVTNPYEHMEGSHRNAKTIKLIINSPSEYRSLRYENELLHAKANELDEKICIPDAKTGKQRLREIIAMHAHTILVHLGIRKNLRNLMWWKDMIADANDFHDTCSACNSAKACTTKPYESLKTIETTTRLWLYIELNSEGPSLSSMNQNETFDMSVSINRLTRLVLLAPANRKRHARRIAEEMFDSVYILHGLSERIVNDKNNPFTDLLWSHPHKLIGVGLKIITTHLPRTDGATERVTKTMVQILRQCVSPEQQNWAINLPAVEFAMSSARSDIMNFSSLLLNYGRIPAPTTWDHSNKYPIAREFALLMKGAIRTAQDAVIIARIQRIHCSNRHRHHSEMLEGDLVYFRTENSNLHKGISRESVPRCIGPYEIVKIRSPDASFRFELPNEPRWRVTHLVLHASLSRLNIPDGNQRFPGRDLKQVSAFSRASEESITNEIVNRYRKGKDALFKGAWTSNDIMRMTYQDDERADALRPYCEPKNVASAGFNPKEKDEPPGDNEPRYRTIGLEDTKERISSDLGPLETHSDNSLSTLITVYHIPTNIQFTELESVYHRQYNDNRIRCLVADDKGNKLNKVLLKPADCDNWANDGDLINDSNRVSEKKNWRDLDANRFGRRSLKQSIFQNVASVLHTSAGRSRSSLCYDLADKMLSNPIYYSKFGTLYPKTYNMLFIVDPDSYLQLDQEVCQIAGCPLMKAASSISFATPAATYRHTATYRFEIPLILLRTLDCVVNLKNFERTPKSLAIWGKQIVSMPLSPMESTMKIYDIITMRDIYILLILNAEAGLATMDLKIS